MQREGLRQRIQYLIEHGGTYPEERRTISRQLLWLLVLIAALQAATIAIELLR